MKKYLSIGEVETRCGVSKRSLRHYDSIGLLQPSIRSDAGYRYYSDNDLSKLNTVLLYRSLGFSLDKIKEILTTQTADSKQALTEQLRLVREHINRLEGIEQKLSTMLIEGQFNMANVNVFSDFNPDQYEVEVQHKWGNTDAYAQSKQKQKNYSPNELKEITQRQEALYRELANVMEKGMTSDSIQAQELTESLRVFISEYFYDCTHEMHSNLAEMYLQDNRFKNRFENMASGFANYLVSCIRYAHRINS